MRIGSAFLTLVMALALAAPAAATSALSRDEGDAGVSVPLVIDAIVLRPLGLAMTVMGAAFYAFPVVPLTAITRPSDLGKPFKVLVATPGRFTFVDPLGQHP